MLIWCRVVCGLASMASLLRVGDGSPRPVRAALGVGWQASPRRPPAMSAALETGRRRDLADASMTGVRHRP